MLLGLAIGLTGAFGAGSEAVDVCCMYLCMRGERGES